MSEKIKLVTACKCERIINSNMAKVIRVPYRSSINGRNKSYDRKFLISPDFEVDDDGNMIRIYREIVKDGSNDS